VKADRKKSRKSRTGNGSLFDITLPILFPIGEVIFMPGTKKEDLKI